MENKEQKNSFSELLLTYSIYTTLGIFLSCLFESYFFQIGMSIPEIIATAGLVYLPPLICIFALKEFDMRKGAIIASGFWALSAVAFYLLEGNLSVILAKLLIGMSVAFFWMPFNTSYYRHRNGNEAFLGSIYYAVNPAISIILPPLAGLIAQMYGFKTIFAISALAFLAFIPYLSKKIKAEKFTYKPIESLKSIDGLKTIIFFEGFAINIVVSITLSAMILTYVQTPVEFGGFLSGTTIFAIIASGITAKISDHFKDRKNIIIASSIGMLAGGIITASAQNIETFFMGFGILSFFRSILQPLPLALVVDKSKNIGESMIARDIMLGFGRASAVIIGVALILIFDIRAMLIVQTVAAAIYIVLFEIKKNKLKKSTT
ncbi:MFS transporter [Candidatus Micrarchaeota archaeon]|nr:MFS transporter [Candidatus Micrarchaeota archaeon]